MNEDTVQYDERLSPAFGNTRALAAERALADADETIRRVTAERDAARTALADRHQADVREAAETATAAQAAIAELDAENGTLRDRIRELEEACAARDRRIADLARERAEVITDLVTADRKITALREQAAARDKRVAELEQDVVAADERMAGVLDGTFSVGDGTAQAEIERCRARISQLEGLIECRASARCWSETDPERAHLCRCGEGFDNQCPITICDLAIIEHGQHVEKEQGQ